MYYKYSIEELRTICRTHIENFERWARIFIHNILIEKLGEDYFHATGKDGKLSMVECVNNGIYE